MDEVISWHVRNQRKADVKARNNQVWISLW